MQRGARARRAMAEPLSLLLQCCQAKLLLPPGPAAVRIRIDRTSPQYPCTIMRRTNQQAAGAGEKPLGMHGYGCMDPARSRCLRYLGQHVYIVTARWACLPRQGRLMCPRLFGGMSKRKPDHVPMLVGVRGKHRWRQHPRGHDRQCLRLRP